MSTYWHLECESHDPPICSQGEISQHTDYRLNWVRQVWAARSDYIAAHYALERLGLAVDYDQDCMRSAALRFIRQHPNCSVRFSSEYGETQPIDGAADLDRLSS